MAVGAMQTHGCLNRLIYDAIQCTAVGTQQAKLVLRLGTIILCRRHCRLHGRPSHGGNEAEIFVI